MFDGLTILIVEDEPLVALDLADTITSLGGRVIGPAESVGAALALIDDAPPSAAILDANLLDRDVTPLAIHLLERGTPFIVHTGIGLPDELRALHPNIPVVMKPAPTQRVMEALDARMHR